MKRMVSLSEDCTEGFNSKFIQPSERPARDPVFKHCFEIHRPACFFSLHLGRHQIPEALFDVPEVQESGTY